MSRSLRSILLPLVYLAAVTALIYRLFSGWAYDDPFITYRYAYNLSHGLGPVYNAGERVLSTTTPLFALLLGVLAHLWPDLPHLANLIGAFSLALGGLFLWDLAQSWETPLAGWAGLLLYPTFPLLATTLGSETPLYLALCLGAFASYARQRYGWAATCSALALLARPDGALVPLLLGADYLLRGQRAIPWRAVLLFLVLALPWFVFAWSFYGSPLPVTLFAKQQQGSMAVSQRFAAGFLAHVQDYAHQPQYWLEALLALAGLAYLVTAARRWTLLLAWTLLYFTAYSLLGVSRYYWYYAPLVPGFVALVGLGITGIIHFLAKQVRSRAGDRGDSALQRLTVGSLTPWTLLAIAVTGALAIAQLTDLLQIRRNPDRRAAVYQDVGRWLEANTRPGDRVGALEVGIIGYYTRRPMVDFAGLLQPEVAAQLPIGTSYQDAALWALEQYRPEYLVLIKGDFPGLESGYVARRCEAVEKFPGKLYKYRDNILVYACQ